MIRFIDDIFLVSREPIDLDDFLKYFIYLGLNFTKNDIINFLDLYIKYDKPTNTFGYLLPSCNHPDRIFNNIIKSLFIRLRRIYTDYSDFITASITLTSQLAKRNYSITKIKEIFIAISQTSRNDLLPYKIKDSLDFNKNILFFVILIII